MSVNDSPNSDTDHLSGLIALHREEEERLRAMISDSGTSLEVKNQANIKLPVVLAAIRGYEEELAQLRSQVLVPSRDRGSQATVG